MALLVLAFPRINEKDFSWIQAYRKKNDKLFYDIVNPHFTIVFPVSNISETVFVEEIHERAKEQTIIDFEITNIILNKDAFNEYYHEFLIPGKGNPEIIKLHDILYSKKLISQLRFDIPFIPHIGIGNSKDIAISKKRIDNLRVPLIKGQIKELTIARYENKIVSEIESISLP
jgi:2'-5' RNA ligase